MLSRVTSTVLVALAICTLLTGCHGAGAGSSWTTLSGPGWTRGTPLGQSAATFALGTEHSGASLPPLDPDALGAAGRVEFTPWDAQEGQGAMLVIERDPPQSGGEGLTTWRTHRLVGSPHALAPQSDQTFVRTADGSVALAEEVQHQERVEVVFDPPLIVIPAGAVAGAPPIQQRLRMTVHPLGDRTRTRSAGSATNTVRYAADQSVRTPQGDRIARRIESTLTADLGPAKVVNRSSTWHVDGLGLVAQREEEQTTIFGLPSRNNRSAWVIAPAR